MASTTVAAGFTVGPFVCLAWGPAVQVMAFGDVAVETDQPSLPMLTGAGSRTWVEHSLPLNGDRPSSRSATPATSTPPPTSPPASCSPAASGSSSWVPPRRRPRSPPAPEPADVPEASRRARHGRGARARRGGARRAGRRRPPPARRRPSTPDDPERRWPPSRRPPSAPTASRCTSRRGAPAPPDQRRAGPPTSPTPTIPTSRCRRRSRSSSTSCPTSSRPTARGSLVDAKMCGNGHPEPARRRPRARCAASSWRPGRRRCPRAPAEPRPPAARRRRAGRARPRAAHRPQPRPRQRPGRARRCAGDARRRQGLAQPPRGPLPGLGGARRRLRVDERHVRRPPSRRAGGGARARPPADGRARRDRVLRLAVVHRARTASA